MFDENDKPLTQRLHEQTALLNWNELQRHFARGSVIVVHPQLDLVRVASQIVEDDCTGVTALLGRGELRHATDDDARRWQREDAEVWAVVVAPWVIVQDNDSETSTR